jgi:predicted Holliday junction resolvase-like endonuclease
MACRAADHLVPLRGEMMPGKHDDLFAELARFFRAARHLWGRCPRCGDMFRLSDAAISFGSRPPRDWLQRLQRQQRHLDDRAEALCEQESDLRSREDDVRDRERELESRERRLDSTARSLAKEMLKSEATVRALVREEKQKALQRSRSTLLGQLFERLGPFSQKFGHDPRDMRAIMDPIDYVVFNGLTMNRCVDYITFVEVKAGLGRESPCQRSIAESIRRGNVEIKTLQIGDGDLPLSRQLKEGK